MAKKILIVEDDAVARHILHTALRNAGYDATIAADAMGALSVAQKNRPDAIILDLGLPAGGGLSFLKRIKVFPALAIIPVLVVSGQDRVTAEPTAMEAGATAYLEKPVDPAIVIAWIRRLLGEAHG